MKIYCLDVGKTYVNAYGRQVKIVKQIGLRFVGDDDRLYSSNGQYRLDGRSPTDLVAEADHGKGGN